MLKILKLAAAALLAAEACGGEAEITPAHRAYLSRGVIAYVYWGPNTYLSGREQNYGDMPLESVSPTSLDTAEWAKVLKSGGVRAAVLHAGYNDGFKLWNSRTDADYSTRALKGKFASIDLAARFEKSCRRQGIGFGLALSLWNRRAADFGDAAYARRLTAQWEELLSRVGGIDLACLEIEPGGRGWYGAAREGRGESRRVKADYYPFARMEEAVKRRFPDAAVVGARGFGDVERTSGGRAEASDSWRYSQRRAASQEFFTVQEVLVPLRKSLFFREDEKPKSLDEMVKIYFDTVGRGAVLALAVSPDRSGRICESDAARLREFGSYLREFESSNYARGSMIGRLSGGGRESGVSAVMGGPRLIDTVDFAEDLSGGQVVDSWTVEVFADGEWKRVASGRSVGWRRIARFNPVTATRARVVCRGDSLAKIVGFAVRKTPEL